MAISAFIPQIWSDQLLLKLRAQLKYAQAGVVNHDYEGEIATAGSSVNITNFADVSISTYTKNSTTVSYQGLTDATQQLVVNQADYFAFQVDDVDKRQALPNFIPAVMQGAAWQLGNKLDSYVSGLMVAGVDSGNIIGSTGATNSVALTVGAEGYKTATTNGTVYGALLQLKTKLDLANVPDDGSRWAILPPQLYAYLLQDNRFVNSINAGQTMSLANGQVGTVLGFNVIQSNTVPSDGTAGDFNLIAGHPMAVTVAEQIVETEAVRLQTAFSDAVRGLHLYGAKVIRPTALAMMWAKLA